jgi:hypothetical protein
MTMNAILKRLQKLADDELLALSEAIDVEISHRLGRTEEVPDSARRRAIEREQSYRRRTGSTAPPIVAVGIGKTRKERRAA